MDSNEINPRDIIAEADSAMSSKDWHQAHELFLKAKVAILDSLAVRESSELRRMLSALDGEGINHGRIAMARDYRDRIVGLRGWVLKNRLEGTSAVENRVVFQQVRHELSLNSLIPFLRTATLKSIDSIVEIEKIDRADYFKVSEVIFAYIYQIFTSVDPDNEEGLVQFCMEIEDDTSFEAVRCVSRSRNTLAVEDRIQGHYLKILKSDFFLRLYHKHQDTVFLDLLNEIFSVLEVRRDSEKWASLSYLIKNGILPSDFDE